MSTISSGIMSAGTHYIKSIASDLSTGLYFAKIHAGEFNAVKKIVLIK
ncbi:MAG: hypothetical protein PHW79_06735 [Candidatus Marinimicrobia bacterium]|nr:hypothetical protein [Candidatus Neomarinimicrobiota bacterium]